MREFDLLDIIGIMVISIGVLILTPILLYSLYTFHKIKNSSDLIKYRNKRLVYAMNGLSMLSFCTESAFIIITQVLRIPDGMIPEYTCFIAAYLFIFGFHILFVIKTWLSYYLSAYHSILVELAWSKDTNPTTSKSVNNEWFIKYKHKLGDYKYLIKIGFIPFLLLLAIQIIIDIHVTKAEPIAVIIPLLCTLLIFIVLSILYCKMFTFNDIYQIKKEIQYQTTILLLIILINIIGFVAHLISHISDVNHVENHNNATASRRMEWLLGTVISYISLFSISLISTAFPVYLYKKNLNVSQLQHNQSNDETNNKIHHFLDGMLNIISNEHGYKAFMVHLIKEYSTESILFIQELCQIKYNFQLNHGNVLKLPKCIDLSAISTDDGEYKPTTTDSHTKIASSEKMTVDFNVKRIEPLYNKNVSQNHSAPKSPSPSSPETMDTNDICVNFEDIRSNISVRSNSGSSNNTPLQLPPINTFLFHDTGGIFCKLVLPGNLPQSAIINTYSNNLCKQMECLYKNYICNDSKHEINISYKSRNGLVNLFENNVQNHIENEFDIFNIFDEAAIEILRLAFNSFSRFIETVSYNEVKEKMKNDKDYAGISNISADFDLEVVHSEESYHKICDLYPTNSASLQSVSAMTIN